MKNNSIELIQEILTPDLKSDIMNELKEHDFYSFIHSRDVAFMTAIFLSNEYFLFLSEKEKYNILRGALYHDVGKIFVPNFILDKKDKLSEYEMNIVKEHCLKGKEYCVKNNIWNPNILKCVEQHHERLDGSGYPYNLQENEIYIGAQIIGLLDVFDALRSYRSYKRKYSEYKVMEYFLFPNNKKLFNKEFLKLCLSEKMMNELYDVKKKTNL